MFRLLLLALATAGLLNLAPSAQADIVRSAGFNVLSGNSGVQAGSGTLAAGVYGGDTIENDDQGRMLNNGVPSYSLVFDAASVFGPGVNPGGTLDAATLFFDLSANGSDNGNGADQPFSAAVSINGALAATITEATATFVGAPNPDGTPGYSGTDPSNFVLDLTGAFLSDLQTHSAYTITLTWLSGNPFSIDGVNLQGQLLRLAAPEVSHHPEPASLLAWGLIMGMGAMGYRSRNRTRKG